MFVELEHVPVGDKVRHYVPVVVVELPVGLQGEVVQGQVDQVRPGHVHPLETLTARVTQAADKQPRQVTRDDGHVVGAGSQAPLMEPLAAPDTLDHLTVPLPWTTTVTIHILQTK